LIFLPCPAFSFPSLPCFTLSDQFFVLEKLKAVLRPPLLPLASPYSPPLDRSTLMPRMAISAESDSGHPSPAPPPISNAFLIKGSKSIPPLGSSRMTCKGYRCRRRSATDALFCFPPLFLFFFVKFSIQTPPRVSSNANLKILLEGLSRSLSPLPLPPMDCCFFRPPALRAADWFVSESRNFLPFPDF